MKKIKILRSTTFWRSFFWVNLSFFLLFLKQWHNILCYILWSMTSKVRLLKKRQTLCLIPQRTIDCTSHGYRPTPFYTFSFEMSSTTLRQARQPFTSNQVWRSNTKDRVRLCFLTNILSKCFFQWCIIYLLIWRGTAQPWDPFFYEDFTRIIKDLFTSYVSDDTWEWVLKPFWASTLVSTLMLTLSVNVASINLILNF